MNQKPSPFVACMSLLALLLIGAAGILGLLAIIKLSIEVIVGK
jgi:hypothetical protein